MIFLTIGSHEPFDRLVRAVDEWCTATGRGDEVFGQITDRAKYIPSRFRSVAKLSPEAFRERCGEAALIVSHAGMGSIITALSCRKPIVILPRRYHLNETRNDHQYATVQRLGTRPGLHVALTEAELFPLLNSLADDATLGRVSAADIQAHASRRLLDAIRGFIFQEQGSAGL